MFTFVVLLLLYVSGETKVTELHTVWSGHQNVAHCNISVTTQYTHKQSKNIEAPDGGIYDISMYLVIYF